MKVCTCALWYIIESQSNNLNNSAYLMSSIYVRILYCKLIFSYLDLFQLRVEEDIRKDLTIFFRRYRRYCRQHHHKLTCLTSLIQRRHNKSSQELGMSFEDKKDK